jgi:hypothetical protein
MTPRKDERMFTIELRSKGEVKNVALVGDEKIFIEGSLGTFQSARFVEDLILEIIGSNGELRVDLTVDDLKLHPHKAEGLKEDRGNDQ